MQIGIMKVGAHIDDLMLIDQRRPKPKVNSGRHGQLYRKKAQVVSTSIDVRGKNLDDAVMDVEKYIDDAFLGGLPEVTIIHGRGEGILKKGLREELSKNKHVKSFKSAPYNDGGEGCTVVELKSRK